MSRPISYTAAHKHQKQLREIRKLVEQADLSFITSARHGKLVELVDTIRCEILKVPGYR